MRKRIVLILAAVMWLGGAASLLSKGSFLLISAHGLTPQSLWPWAAAALGVIAGIIKARFVMSKSCKKNIRRICSIPRPMPWHFFSKKFFVALMLMIAAGVTMSRLAQGHFERLCVVGCLDLSIGIALLISSRFYPAAVVSTATSSRISSTAR